MNLQGELVGLIFNASIEVQVVFINGRVKDLEGAVQETCDELKKCNGVPLA